MKTNIAFELFKLQEKLRRDESLTMPEQRWLAWVATKIKK